MDVKAKDRFIKVRDAVAAAYIDGTIRVLQEKNPRLLNKIDQIEDEIWSLIKLVEKTKEQKKRFADLLRAWKHGWDIARVYVERHPESLTKQ
jgi:hypothetical protein